MKKITPIIILSLAMFLTACDSGDDDPHSSGSGPNTVGANVNTAFIDATDRSIPAYFDFDTGTVVSADQDWDVGFIRDKIIVNTGKRTGIVDKQEEYYEADGLTPANSGQVFANADDDIELLSLLGVTEFTGDWINSGIKAAIDNSWYAPTHPLSTSGQYFILRSAEGNSYAKMTFSSADVRYNLSFNFYVQGSGDSTFNGTAIQWSTDISATHCFDFDDPSNTDCSSSTWDIKIATEGRAIYLYTNGGVSGDGDAAVYKIADTESEADYQHGDFNSADNTGVFSAAWVTDVDASVFADYSWYAYDPLNAGTHQLYSNYRVYVIDTDVADADNESYKMQVTSYYDSISGASAHYTIRYTVLSDDE